MSPTDDVRSAPRRAHRMRRTPIVIVGAGGHGRETALLLETMIADGARFELAGFLDDDATRHGSQCGDLPVLGGLPWLAGRHDVAIALGIGSPRAKQQIVHRLAVAAERLPSLVHPSVTVHRRVRIGAGSQLHAGTIVTTDVDIGCFVTCNRRVDLSHDCIVDDLATLAPSVTLAGAVRIAVGADLGVKASCLPGVHVGAWCVVGAGAVVTRDVAEGLTVVGVPARPLPVRPVSTRVSRAS